MPSDKHRGLDVTSARRPPSKLNPANAIRHHVRSRDAGHDVPTLAPSGGHCRSSNNLPAEAWMSSRNPWSICDIDTVAQACSRGDQEGSAV